MRLLVITQKIDKNDPILGFFCRWVEEFSKRFEKVTVICLEKGDFDLPPNVKVLSLGKEEGRSHAEYLSRLYHYLWQERGEYDKVFVHMNQEYVLLAGLLWRFMGKKVYLWRNHLYGNFLTRIAVALSHKVFCTSSQSFTARYKKTRIMPVGVDTEFFQPDLNVVRRPKSILFLGRIAPVKKVLEFVDYLHDLDVLGEEFTATIAGKALPVDIEYERQVREMVSEYGLSERVSFVGAVTREQALKLFQSHETYVNKTPAGSFDKTILEALACGCNLVVDNPEAKDLKVEEHSLDKLMQRLAEEMK